MSLPLLLLICIGLPMITFGLIVALGLFAKPIERSVKQAADQIHKLETGKAKEADIGGALKIVGGIALLMLTLVGVLTVAKGMGLGPMGKGIGMLVFTGGAALLWATYAMIRRGHAKWVFAGLGAVAVAAATMLGLSRLGQPVGFPEMDMAIAQIGDEIQGARDQLSEARRQIGVELKVAINEVDEELFADAGKKIPLDEDANNEDEEAEEEAIEPTESAAEDSSTGLVLGERVVPLPDWTTGPVEGDEYRIVSEPFLSEALARDNALQRFAERAVAEYNESGRGGLEQIPESIDPRELWKKGVTEEFVECRKTSFGDTYVVHAKGTINDEVDAWFRGIADEFVAEQQRRRGLVAVSAGSGGVLLALSALYGALSLGGKRTA